MPANPNNILNEQLKLHFGALAEPLETQLKSQHITVDDVTRYQKQADAITLLNLSGLMPDAWAQSTRKKLFNKILREIQKGVRHE